MIIVVFLQNQNEEQQVVTSMRGHIIELGYEKNDFDHACGPYGIGRCGSRW